MFKAIIFDMDGVMFDTEAIAYGAWKKTVKEFGILTPEKARDLYIRMTGLTVDATVSLISGALGTSETAVSVLKSFGANVQEAFATEPIPVKTGLFELLGHLETIHMPTAIASSSPRQAILHHLSAAGVKHSFDKIISGDEVSHSKPDPMIYLLACEKLGVLPAEAIVIEDSKNGLLSAFRAGCKTVYVPDMWRPEPGENTEFIWKQFADLSEVCRWLQAV